MAEHKTLAGALVAFQAEAPKLLKGNTAKAGSFSYKYVDLKDVMDAIQPVLSKHGLAWSAYPCFGPNGEPALRYKLTHSSGDCESDSMPLLLQKSDPQGLGSGITYARRYALTAVLNLVADEDDDGQKASTKQPRGEVTTHPPAVPKYVASITAAAKGLTRKQIIGCLGSKGLEGDHLDTEPPFRMVPVEKSGALIAALKDIPR